MGSEPLAAGLSERLVMINTISELSWRMRGVIALFCIMSALFTFLSLTFVDYHEHRGIVNERLDERRKAMFSAQENVAKVALKILPSLKNGDTPPTEKETKEFLSALDQLSAELAAIETHSDEMQQASDAYRDSIAKLSKALIRISYDDPRSFSDALYYVDQWDKAAKSYTDAINTRVDSYIRTLWPSF